MILKMLIRYGINRVQYFDKSILGSILIKVNLYKVKCIKIINWKIFIYEKYKIQKANFLSI